MKSQRPYKNEKKKRISTERERSFLLHLVHLSTVARAIPRFWCLALSRWGGDQTSEKRTISWYKNVEELSTVKRELGIWVVCALLPIHSLQGPGHVYPHDESIYVVLVRCLALENILSRL